MTLTKKDIIEKVIELDKFHYRDRDDRSSDPYAYHGLDKIQCKSSVNSLLEIIKESLEKGNDILVSGFGKFSVKDKRERKGRNPSTGDSIQLQARRVVTFKYSGNLRKAINGK